MAIEVACSGPAPSKSGAPEGAQNADGAVAPGDTAPPGPDGAPSLVIPEGGVWPPDAQPPPFMDPFGGASGCDGGVDAGVYPISLMMPVRGALTAVIGWPNGVSGGGGAGRLDWRAVLPDSTAVDVTLFLSQLRAGVVGPQPSASFEIRWYNQPDAGSVVWLATSSACTVTIASNACAPSFARLAGSIAYVVSGTGSCSQPIGPESGNPNGPLTVGDFYFVSYFLVPSGDH